MIAGIKIQSISDIITNSSSEVFVSEKSEALIKALEIMGIGYDYYETEEQLRKAVEAEPSDFDELVDFNIYRDVIYYLDEFHETKTDDEIWDFFKVFYIDLVGKVVINVDRDYLYRQEENCNIDLFKLIKE